MKEKLEKLKELRTEVEKLRDLSGRFETSQDRIIGELTVEYLEHDFKVIDTVYVIFGSWDPGSGISHIVYGDYLYFVDAGVICKEV